MATSEDTPSGLKSTRTDPFYLLMLMEKLEPSLHYQMKAENTRYTISYQQQSKCYFIRSGAISFYRQPGDILLEMLDAPTLRGIIPVPPDSGSSYVFKTIVPSEIAVIDKEVLFTLLTEHDLWKVFALYQLAVQSVFVERFYKQISPKAYTIIRSQLYELMSKPESVRNSILAEAYIRSKTHLSRSGIMRILSDLREGNYIIIEKGILKAINHLPENY